MSEFEFLRNITIGQYLPTGSSIHRLDTRARILSAAIILTAVTLAPRLQGLLLGFVVILALLAAARIPLGYALRGLLPPLPFLLALAGLQVLFNPRPEISPVLLDVGPLLVKVTDLLAGAKLLVRFGALVLGLSLTSFCVSTSEMIHGLESLLSPFRRLRLPTHDLVLTVQITLRFIPFLAQSAERIAKAQASRGADWGAGRG
ncbi:MAG: energy-coupling factor transporter transmembrane component T, partial [Anaerolineaceae bacterium]|nr:energy-coupling factor transporter transmembrane component T [Anaerolineaceae bacterium]